MNKKLAAYLQQLPTDAARGIWLDAIASQAKNGTANIIYRDIMASRGLSRQQVVNLLNARAAEQAAVIKILASTDSFLSINFKVPRKANPAAAVAGLTQTPPPNTTETKPKSPRKTKATLPAVIQKPMPVDDQQLMLPPLPDDYEPSTALIRWLIWDYCQFYKGMIQARAALVGNYIERPLNPKIMDYDVRALREMCKYFAANGIAAKGEITLRAAFQRMYSQWHLLPGNYQNFFTPAQINRNINGIYANLVQVGGKPKPINRKDAELTEKIRQNQERDYSHLAD